MVIFYKQQADFEGKTVKHPFIKSLLSLCLLFSGMVWAVENSPDKVVMKTANNVIEKIEKEHSSLLADPSLIYGLVDELIIPHFDFVSMSKWVLGKHWKNAVPEQRVRFVEQFKTLLVRTYARALLEYSGHEIKYLPVQRKPDSSLAVVKTELIQPDDAKPLPINYRMYHKDETWKVVDVTVDGVSLVTTYRGSFDAQIRTDGFDTLIKELSDKNTRFSSGTENSRSVQTDGRTND